MVARAESEGRPLKMRATRDAFATMQSFACSRQATDPDAATFGSVDGKAPLVVGLLLNKMNQVLAVDKEKHQMTVQGQIILKDFFAAATANGMSVPRASLPWWQGLTLAGIMATTSHGSGLNQTSMIVRVVQSFGVGRGGGKGTGGCQRDRKDKSSGQSDNRGTKLLSAI